MNKEEMAREILGWISPDGAEYHEFYEILGVDESDRHTQNVVRGIVAHLVKTDQIHREKDGKYYVGRDLNKPVLEQKRQPRQKAEGEQRWMWWKGVDVQFQTVTEYKHVLRITYTQDEGEQDVNSLLLSGPVKLWLSKDSPDETDGFGPQTVVVWNVTSVIVDYQDPIRGLCHTRHYGMQGMKMHLFAAPWVADK